MPASSNAIGSASIVLSANADGLVKGLDRAKQKTTEFAGGVKKTLDNAGIGKTGAGGGSGGVLGNLLGRVPGAGLFSQFKGGAAAGAGAGLALAGVGVAVEAVKKVADYLAQLPERVERLKTAIGVATEDRGGLAAMSVAFKTLGNLADRFEGRLISGLAPAVTQLGTYATALLGQFDKVLEGVGAKLGAVALIGVETFGQVALAVGDVVKWVDDATGGFFLLGLGGNDSGKAIFGAFRQVAGMVGLAWDAIRLGPGIMAAAAGGIVAAVGEIQRSLATMVKTAAIVTSVLPDRLRPAWAVGLQGMADLADRIVQANDGVRDRLLGMAANAVLGFGQNAAAAMQFADAVQGRFERMRKDFAKGFGGTAALSGAFQRNTVEAYSVTARFSSQNAVAEDIQKRQLRELQEIRRGVQEAGRIIGGIAANPAGAF